MSSDPKIDRKTAVVSTCLAGLAVALLMVGVVSGTILRHIVQIVPLLAAIHVVRRRPPFGAYAALPIFFFWTLIVTLIWMFLAGLSTIANGRYTAAEIVSTIVMAACCVFGAPHAIQMGRRVALSTRVATFLLFATFQVAAMWLSFTTFVANR